jgi:hypothetical protein
LRETAELDPRNGKISYNWGNALLLLNEREEAFDKYENFLRTARGAYPQHEAEVRRFLKAHGR